MFLKRLAVFMSLSILPLALNSCSSSVGSSVPFQRQATSSVLLNTFLNRSSVALQETPFSAPAFIDSIGVATKWNLSSSPCNLAYCNVSALESLIASLGIHHIRGGIDLGQEAIYSKLASGGIFDAAVIYYKYANPVVTTSQTEYDNFIASTTAIYKGATVSAVDTLENANEIDQSGNPNFLSDLAYTLMPNAYSFARNNSLTKSIPVVCPSFAYAKPYADLQATNQLGFCNVANIHTYYDTSGTSYPEETSSNGLVSYYLMQEAVHEKQAGPTWATESGYGTSGTGCRSFCVDESVKFRYLQRLLLFHFANGVTRTDIQELADESANGYGSTFGIIDKNDQPKASYTELDPVSRTIR